MAMLATLIGHISDTDSNAPCFLRCHGLDIHTAWENKRHKKSYSGNAKENNFDSVCGLSGAACVYDNAVCDDRFGKYKPACVGLCV